jgi:hypothetical protein
MTNHRTVGTAPATIGDLLQGYGDRWRIAFEATLNVWSGERCSPDGRHIRFLAGRSPAELAARLSDAEVSES